MAQLNFPTTGLTTGTEYTGDNGVVYTYDGTKWIGHSLNISTGTNNSIINNGNTVQVDPSGNLIIPNGATIKYASGAPVVTGGSATTSTLVNGSFTATLDTYGNFSIPAVLTNSDPGGSGVSIHPGYAGQSVAISNNAGNQEYFVQDDGAYVQTSVNNSGTVFNQWKFGLDGGLTLPDGSNFGNGGWNTTNGIALVNHDTDFSLSSVVMVEASGQAMLHSQNDSGTIQLTVKTDSLNNVITVVNNSSTWTFGADGVLTLPSTVGDIKRDGVSVLGGGGRFATTSTLINNSATVTLTTAGNLIVPGIVQSANTLTLSAGVVNPLYWWAEFGDFNVGTTSTYGIGVVHDPSGNLWVFGSVQDFGTGVNDDTLALKYDQYGNLLWQAQYRDANTPTYPACASNDIITFDNVGNAYYLANDENNNLTYIGKMDANGNTVNQELFYTNGYAEDMVFDSNNHILLVGSQQNYYNTVTTNTYSIPYVMKVDESYNILWQIGIDVGTIGYNGIAQAVAVDSSNNVYVVGSYNLNAGGLVSFIYKVDTNGNLLWILETGIPLTGNPDMSGQSVGINNGYLYVLAYNYNNYFNVITKYDLNGNQIWQQISDDYTRTPNNDYYVEPGYDLNFDSAGNIYITSVGGGDIFGNTAIILTKMEPTAGAVVYQRALMSPEHSLENSPHWWVGHRQASIYNDRIAISAYTQYSAPASTGTNTSFAFTIQMPIDGSVTGTFNGISVNDVTAAFSTATYAGTYTSTVTSLVAIVTTATGNTGTLAPVTLLVTGTNTLTNNTYNLVPNGVWQFSETGTITFPDGTRQSTAWTGSYNTSVLSSATSGYYSSVVVDPYLNIDLNLNGVEVGYLGFDASNDFYIQNRVNSGHLYLETSNSGGSTVSWTLGPDGSLTLPLGSQLLEKTWSTTVTAITTGTSTYVTFAANEFQYPELGEIVIAGVQGATQANGTYFYQAVDPNVVKLYGDNSLFNPIDSTAWNTYTSGGTVTLVTELQLNSNGNAWKFMADGSTILPPNQKLVLDENSDTYLQVGMGFRISSSEPTSIQTVDQTNPSNPVFYRWNFGLDGTFHFPDNSIQTTSAQVQFRAPNLPIGAAGDTQGALAYNTITNSFYLATASYVQEILTTSTFDIVANQDYDWGQSGDQFMSVTISKGAYPGIDTLLNAGVTTGWTISGDPTIYGIVTVTNVSLHNIDNVSWSFDWAPQEGYPTSFSSGTAFTLYNTVTPAQPNIWQQIVTGQVWQLSSGTENLSMFNPYSDHIELATNSSTRMSIYAGQGFELAHISDLSAGDYNWNQETTGTIVYQGVYSDPTRGIAIENYHNNSIDPYVLFDNNGGIQFNDYTTNPLGYPGFLTVPFASISRTTGTMSIGVTDFTVNTGTTATWTFSSSGTIVFPDSTVQTTAYTGQGYGSQIWVGEFVVAGTTATVVDAITSVQYDSQYNILATGNVVGNSNPDYTVVMKLNPTGQIMWQQAYSTGVNVDGWGLAVNQTDDVYIAGSNGNNGLFIIKMSGQDGSGEWGQQLTSSYQDCGWIVDVGPDNNPVVVGYAKNSNGDKDIIITKFLDTSGGENAWQTIIGDTGINEEAYGMAIGPAGEVVAIGYSQTTASNAVFIVKTDVNGTVLWQNEYHYNNDANDCTGVDAAIDSSGNIYASLNLGTGSGVLVTTVKLDSSGNILWARDISGPCAGVASALAIGPDGNVYITGVTVSEINTATQVIVGSYDSSGNEQWQRRFNTLIPYTIMYSGAGIGGIIDTPIGSNIDVKNNHIVISGGSVEYEEFGSFKGWITQFNITGDVFDLGTYELGISNLTDEVTTGITTSTTTKAVTSGTLTMSSFTPDYYPGGLALTEYASNFSASTNQLVNGAYTVTLDSNGTLSLPGNAQFPHFTITTATGTNGQVLTLDGSGNASWQTPTGGGGSGWQLTSSTAVLSLDSTNTLTLPVGGTITEGTSPAGLGHTITLTPAGGNDSNQQLLIYPTVTEGNHLHLTSGALGTTSIFLGNDNQYVRTRADGAMVIGTGDSIPDQAGVGHRWTFGTDGNLVVPGAIQSTNGIVISNAGVVGATAGIVLPANAGTGAVQIGNTYGPIQLGSAAGGGTELNWTFDTTGILTVPITASGAGQISGGTNGLQLVSNSNTWGFGTDASLTVPGIITLPNGQGQIGNGGAGIDIICNVNSYGYITLNYLSQASVSVNTSGIVLTSNSSSWTFNSGSIQFPDATNQLTAFELQGVPPLSPWGTTYPSSGGIANLDYQFYFDPTSGYPTIQSYSSNGGNPLYNSMWSYDAWISASNSLNPTASSSGGTPIQVTNTGGVTVIGSQLQPGDYVTVRIMNIDTGRIFRATFMGSYNSADTNDTPYKYGAITVERLL